MQRGLPRGWLAATELRYRIAGWSLPSRVSVCLSVPLSLSPPPLSLYLLLPLSHTLSISLSPFVLAPREMEMNLLYYSPPLLVHERTLSPRN